ncbi:hypothetical protein AYI70_g4514, partial [Smittium culicis]
MSPMSTRSKEPKDLAAVAKTSTMEPSARGSEDIGTNNKLLYKFTSVKRKNLPSYVYDENSDSESEFSDEDEYPVMPKTGSKSAPIFDGNNAERFFNQIESLAIASNLNEEKLVKILPNYCSKGLANLVKLSLYYKLRKWIPLKEFIMELYPETEIVKENNEIQEEMTSEKVDLESSDFEKIEIGEEPLIGSIKLNTETINYIESESINEEGGNSNRSVEESLIVKKVVESINHDNKDKNV